MPKAPMMWGSATFTVVVVTIAEEIGLCGAKALGYSLLRARRGIALDTSGVDLVINRAPCANKLRFTVTGREAHAGIAPEKGISAIEIAAAFISPRLAPTLALLSRSRTV